MLTLTLLTPLALKWLKSHTHVVSIDAVYSCTPLYVHLPYMYMYPHHIRTFSNREYRKLIEAIAQAVCY